MTLPCGASVCTACVKQPAPTDEQLALEADLAKTFESNTLPHALSFSIRSFRCPAKHCRRKHTGTPVADWVLGSLVRVLFPTETKVLDDAVVVPGSGLQLPLLVRSRRLLREARFEEAIRVADEAHVLNPWNRRGLIARRIAELRWREAGLDVMEIDDPGMDTGGSDGGVFVDPFKLKQGPPGVVVTVPPVPQGVSLGSTSSGSQELGIDCPLCLNPVVGPITLKCGHSACRVCLLDSCKTLTACGVCRAPLPTFESLLKYPENVVLGKVISEWMKGNEGWMKVKEEHAKEMEKYQAQTEYTIPLFVCTLAFPGTKQEFNIFEPRYRVMVKECLDEDGVFGLCIPKRSLNPFDEKYSVYGTAVSIEMSEAVMLDLQETSKGPLPRYYIQSKSRFRFKIVEEDVFISPEGLHYAKVKRIEDVDPDYEDVSYDSFEYAVNILKVRQNVHSMLTGLDPIRVQLLIQGYGKMPDDPALLSFWALQWVPMNIKTKYELLSCINPCERIRYIADRL
ncbi:hypothetical protein BCR33DRAFT_719990 [Rhizoclosmatium globosum]|uniref:LON-domain-containing protein n=1 Tax=Rhizoclosmatium globosum TaxID=329046 RepID=A0A1Y2BXP6_9FUNG|nr:hypothetical protein BCR33DRAFT_719990 [Rhizoclosmatium globosum]|eukprot:ORY39516.1 hypothetical protein BCR33DRAFT_719990 [Rhizoclosmatium globosum]